MIEGEKWIIGEPEEAFPDDRSFYDDDSPHLEFYEQALIDKEVIVIHSYPIVDEE